MHPNMYKKWYLICRFFALNPFIRNFFYWKFILYIDKILYTIQITHLKTSKKIVKS